MLINYDTAKINAALQDFFNATGIYMDMLGADLSSVSDRRHWADNRYCQCIQVTKEGKKACHASDLLLLERCQKEKTTQIHICHAGLMDVVVPIMYEDDILGYILFGQIKTDTDFSALEDYIAALGLDTSEMRRLYKAIPQYSNDKIESISNIATLIIKHVLLENMLRPDYDEGLQRAVSFIDEALAEPLSVKLISKKAGISKSVLYKRFHTSFGCTISEYINARRIERAAALLQKGDHSIEEVAQRTGFTGTSYFSKTFKKQMGVSPLRYKKGL